MTKRILSFLVVLVLAMAITLSVATAADYPAKNIRIILPYGAGSSQEALLRVACKYVEEHYDFKKSFVISNLEGGSGEIGLTSAITAAHDGYTLAMFHSPHIVLPLVRGEACAFTLDDWAPICNFMTDPGSWLINSKDAETYPDFASLIEAALAAPGTISVGCGGLNTSEGRLIKQIQRDTGAEFKIVPIDNDAEFVSMLRGGHINALVTQVGDVMSAIQEGVFIPLCVGTNERIPALPETKTLKEIGYNIESFSMRSLAAPADIPAEVYELLCKAFDEAVQSEEILSKAAELGVSLDYKTPEEIKAMWVSIDESNRAEWAIQPW
jgi:tripartite-type tricarboxylate transporter receptor subunit TctC